MLSKKGIKYKFILQLVLLFTALIVTLSTLFYNYIKISIYEDLTTELIQKDKRIDLEHYNKNSKLLDKILFALLVIDSLAILSVMLCAILLSKKFLTPLRHLTTKLENMDEKSLCSISDKNIPKELESLVIGINRLHKRTADFIKYQKELLVGTVHELKTPLAVIKTKNEVTLLKKRDEQKYIDLLHQNNKTIDEMSRMISTIMQMGRLNDTQLEKPVEIDLIEFLKNGADNFKILATKHRRTITTNFTPKSFILITQPTLLMHILQNFIQNAIKFTPEDGNIEIKSFLDSTCINIHVIDEGIGVDESRDIFAPFIRYGDKDGVGLGLYLAKKASDALGATIAVKSRKEHNGAVATLNIPIFENKIE